MQCRWVSRLRHELTLSRLVLLLLLLNVLIQPGMLASYALSRVERMQVKLGSWSSEVYPGQNSIPTNWLRNVTRSEVSTAANARLVEGSNWAGYVYYGSRVTYVKASWLVPTVHPGLADQRISTWVGIGGVGSSLIQTGTGYTLGVYTAWYETVSADGSCCAPAPLFLVGQGDAIFAEVSYLSGNSWSIHIQDFTNGQNQQRTVTFSSSFDTAEWISAETPYNPIFHTYYALVPFDAFKSV